MTTPTARGSQSSHSPTLTSIAIANYLKAAKIIQRSGSLRNAKTDRYCWSSLKTFRVALRANRALKAQEYQSTLKKPYPKVPAVSGRLYYHFRPAKDQLWNRFFPENGLSIYSFSQIGLKHKLKKNI